MKKLNCILLVDDDNDCNYLHKRVLKKAQCAERIEVVNDGEQALHFLKTAVDGIYPCPDLILLDINMPGMNGWEFLEEYEKLDTTVRARIVLVMLTSSVNPDDEAQALKMNIIGGFRRKYLTEESIKEIIRTYFPENVQV
ncbi:MAG TPA: response regulator [Chitinophagales bacterium]|nr:response regulator [Chitinophagales bacterium]